ncbi:MAG: signal peptide peptidase SppA [Balneolaceae bacterium]|nr:MAG: signal peptide peptidase SppA [Balneolaceae bacterium]
MKSFFKTVFAVFTAIILFFFISFFFSLTFIAILSPSDKVEVKENTILHLNLNGRVLAERSSPDDFDFPIPVPLIGNIGDAPVSGLNDLRKAIRSAAESDKIKGIFLEAGTIGGGQALRQELRNELEAFKESGKFIVSYAGYYSEAGYYLSSVADSVYIHPYGGIDFTGLASEGIYLREMFEKIGVEPEIFVVGEYKSAVETFMNSSRSAEDREQTLEFLTDLNNISIEAVAASRGLSEERVRQISDEFLIRRVEDALEHGFAEGIHYRDEVKNVLRILTEREEDDDVNLITANRFNRSGETISEPRTRDRIAVLFADGDIGSESGSGIQDRRMIREIERIRDNDRIKGVVVRVNSPGGSVFASEQIRHELERLQKEKPVVISMGNVAASGGYWISMPADTIVAQSNTITGSIGIFGLFFNVEELLNDKMGIRTDVVKTGQFSDLPNPSRQMNPAERAIFQEFIEEGYDRFINVVAEGRNMSDEEVRLIAEGRVYSGNRAFELGLVDVIGGLDRSVELAAELSETEEYRVIFYPEQKTFFENILEGMGDKARTRHLKTELGPLYPLLEQYRAAMNTRGAQARMPFSILID